MIQESLTARPQVLIVDDLPENLFAMQQLLADVDADLVTAHSGNEALGLMLQHRFCVVLLDVQMPEMDGFETAELMRSHADTKGTPIIFLTAINKEERHVFHGYSSGAVDYIFKPVVPEILLGKVKVFIELYQAMQLARQLERERRKSANLESIGNLAGGLAHDFNNLLFAVLGNIELAQDELRSSPEQALAFLSRAKEALLKGKELTSLMITFSSGGQPLKKWCRVEELLRESVAAVQVPPGISVEFGIATPLPEVKLDWRLMRQAMDNVITNACEAMANGGKLTVSAASGPGAQAAQVVSIRIADTGRGIAETHLDQVFDPYFSTKERCKNKGMGLGLSVANSIIRNHHGAITLRSTKGAGTVVQIDLVVDRAPRAQVVNARQLAPGRQPPVDLRAPRILVMDNDETGCMMTCQMVYSLGLQADGVHNGREAITLFTEASTSEHPYALALLDMTEGDNAGVLTLKAMRALQPRLPAVAVVLSANESLLLAMHSSGFQSCLEKPFTSGELKKVLTLALQM